MATYLITGCSRGLGLELIKQLNSAPTSSVSTVFATARSAPTAALKSIIDSSNGRIRFVQLDVTDNDSVTAAVQSVGQGLGTDGLDVLINNAGIQVFEKGGVTAMQQLDTQMSTNVTGVHRVSSAFLPLLDRGKQKKIVNITSTLGSIGLVDKYAAPLPAYKISKSALNMLTVQYSIDLNAKGYTVFCLSPGWLKTDLGGSIADLEPETGAKATIDIIYSSTRKDSGSFRDIYITDNALYTGSNPPW